MYCIGLTGTIASGKSTAIDFFRTKGIDTLNADDIARQLTQKDTPALAEIGQYFGDDILTPNGELNRRLLRNHIMHHPESRHWLERLLHPQIRQKIELSISKCHSPYCIIEIPLLTDRSAYPYLQRVLLITALSQQQIERLIKRDHCSENEALALLTHQESNNNRATLADDIVFNNGSIDELHQKLNQLHQQYLKEALKLGSIDN